MGKFYVYGHFTLDTNELFYIGKGVSKRAWIKRERNPFWSSIIKKHGYRVEVLLDGLEEDYAYFQEYMAIKELKPRANLNPGGIGACSEQLFLRWQDIEFQEKMKKANKKRWDSVTEERRKEIGESISKSLTGVKKSPEAAKKAKNRLNSKEMRDKCAEGLRKHETRKKIGDSNRGKIRTQEARDRISASHTGLKHTEETKAQMSVSMGSKPFLVFKKKTGEFIGEWTSKAKCARDIGVDNSRIGDVILKRNGRTQHKGFVFIDKDEHTNRS